MVGGGLLRRRRRPAGRPARSEPRVPPTRRRVIAAIEAEAPLRLTEPVFRFCAPPPPPLPLPAGVHRVGWRGGARCARALPSPATERTKGGSAQRARDS